VTRIRVLFVLLLLLVAGIVASGVVWFFKQSQPVQSWRLPDGSEISLAKVTYGQKHQVRYDNRWQDLLYPVLPAKVQSKFGSRVAMHTSSTSNAVVVWIWQRHAAAARAKGFGIPNYHLATVDDNGLESEMLYSMNCRYSLPSGDTFSGWELREYPRRSKQIGVRLYMGGFTGNNALVAEFKIPNRLQINYPVWVPEQLPAIRKTNDLEISLLKLETGLTSEIGIWSAGKDARAFSRGEFTMREKWQATEDWSVTQILASASSGEVRPGGGKIVFWVDHKNVVSFTGALWPEEPAWKLKVEVSRTSRFPPKELWIIKGIPVPAQGKISEAHARTNIYGEEIEFLGLSSPNARLPEDWTEMEPEAGLHARTPFPLTGAHLTLVEVKDDQGRKVETGGFASSNSTGGRGATLRQTDYGFAISIPDGAKTLDVTFAFSQSRYVEFLAKPVMAEPAGKR